MKTSWRRLENVLRTSWRRIDKTNILVLTKTSWRRLEDAFWRRTINKNIFVFIKTSWRRYEEVFWRRRRKSSLRRLQDVFIKTNVCWVSNVFAVSMSLLLFSQCGFSRNKSIEAVVLKSLCWSLFYVNKFAVLKRSATLLKRTPIQVFSCENWEIFKNTFFTEHLRWLLVT